jgi:transcriptional regulator
MYLPQHFEERDLGVLHALIRSHPLSTWVTQVDGELLVNHVPFLLDPTEGEFGTLVGHVARANPVWQKFSKDLASAIVFQGPQIYISPSWYPSKHAHGKVVPTWNYAVVHAHGIPRAIEDKDWLLAHVTKLADTHESTRAVPWAVSDAPPDFIQQMLKAIVGIQIPIAKLSGKWKTSQNRSLPDKLGTIAGLTERGDADAREMAELVRRHTVPKES